MHQIPGTPLPRAAQPFVAFPSILRANGFAVAPDQTTGFLQAITLLGPRDITDIRRSAIAMLAIPRDRWDEFNALFDAYFLGATTPGTVPGDDEEVDAHEAGADAEADLGDPEDTGDEATTAERLGQRDLAAADDAALSDLRRLGPARLPRRRSYRWAPSKGRALDMRRTLRDAARRDGEAMELKTRSRKSRQRRIVLLIDISGSMAERTEDALRLAHTLGQAAERWEVFTLATRLTRVTPALRLANPDQALARASALIADIDGGTRIGEALETFLAVPRYAGFARGAAVTVLSDGLERGTPDAIVAATNRLARLSWRLDWLTPLADGAGFAPQTEALQIIQPLLDYLGPGATNQDIVQHLLSQARLP